MHDHRAAPQTARHLGANARDEHPRLGQLHELGVIGKPSQYYKELAASSPPLGTPPLRPPFGGAPAREHLKCRETLNDLREKEIFNSCACKFSKGAV